MNKWASSDTLYQAMCSTFCILVVMSNLISAKMVEIPYFNLILPAGIITYPFTFLLSDLVTEFFGVRKAKLMVFLALGMNLLSLGMIQFALKLPAASEADQAVFQAVLGLSGWRIFSSLIAYLISQIVDIQVYAWIKNWTGFRLLWLRNNGSTCLSQLLDTVIVDMLYLYAGLGMGFTQVLPIILISYAYKAFLSIATTPFFYLCVYLIKAEWRKDYFQTYRGKIYETSV